MDKNQKRQEVFDEKNGKMVPVYTNGRMVITELRSAGIMEAGHWKLVRTIRFIRMLRQEVSCVRMCIGTTVKYIAD